MIFLVVNPLPIHYSTDPPSVAGLGGLRSELVTDLSCCIYYNLYPYNHEKVCTASVFIPSIISSIHLSVDDMVSLDLHFEMLRETTGFDMPTSRDRLLHGSNHLHAGQLESMGDTNNISEFLRSSLPPSIL